MKTNRFLSVCIAAIICVVCTINLFAYSGGSGTAVDPYQIASKSDLLALAANTGDYNKFFVMTADIDLSGENFTAAVIAPDTDSVTAGFQGTEFSGQFDGGGHVISDISIDASGMDYVGLFGKCSGVLTNLGVVNCIVSNGDLYVGGLCGFNSAAGIINNCYASGSVSGESTHIGGLCGYNQGTLRSCFATGSSSGDTSIGGLIGGLCGVNEGTLSDCYSTGAVSGNLGLGGLCGVNYEGSVSNCFSTGTVSGNLYVGGFCGSNSGTITNSFWDKVTSGMLTSEGGTAKSTSNMKKISTFTNAGWDFIDETANGTDDTWIMIGYPALYTKYSGGHGTEADPYRIANQTELLDMASETDEYNKHFVMIADIDLSATNFTSAVIAPDTDNSTDNFQGAEFSGIFDGGGYEISGMTIDAQNSDYVGLFGRCSGVITNLGLVSCAVTNGDEYVGALCGQSYNGTISACYAWGPVSGSQGCGGLCGRAYNGSINECYATGAVSGDFDVGGLCGRNNGGIISECYATGTVLGLDSNIGGVCGRNNGTISECYATGSVSGGDYVGGLCGRSGDTISGCYSAGAVSGDSNSGGLCGYNGGTVNTCFWDIQTSGQTTSSGGSGKTTTEMQSQTTFTAAGWDFTGETANGTDDTWIMIGYPAFYTKYSGGYGTEVAPYRIVNKADLLAMAADTDDYDKCFVMTADIDLSGTSFNKAVIAPDTDIMAPEFQGTQFSGSFDGGGYVVSNMYISAGGHSYVGLFGRSSGVIKNLGVVSCTLTNGFDFIGGICGENCADGIISGCYLIGSVEGSMVCGGGLCGSSEGTIRNCYVMGSFSGHTMCGGLCGRNLGSISNCYATGPVSGFTSSGGLCGANAGPISGCYAMGSVKGDSDATGGFCGSNSHIINDCYAMGSVSGNTEVGGFCGDNHSIITECYSTGSVSGSSEIGGFCGDDSYGTISDCFWDKETSGMTTSAGGTGKTTANMQILSTFTDAGWDFVAESANGIDDTWILAGYPALSWQNLDSDGDGLDDVWEYAYYTNLIQVATSDTDGDDQSALDEYIAGTIPTNALSKFAVCSCSAEDGDGFLVTWDAVEGRCYNVLWAPDLSTSFTPLESGIDYPQGSCMDTLHNLEPMGFYKIEVYLK